MGTYVERFKQSRVGRFVVPFYAKFSADRATDGAILIAWQALFSLFPLILGFLALFGLILQDPARRAALVEAVQTQFPAQVTDLLSFMEETRDLSGYLGVVSVGLLLWSGSNLFGAMARVFNHFYGAPDRTMFWQRLMAFTMMAIFLVLILLSIAASGLGHSIAALGEWILGYPLGTLAAWVGLIVGLAISYGSAFLMFLAILRVVPNTPLTFRDVWRGAAVSALLFLVVNQLFPLYLRLFGGGFEAYKTFGLFLLLMTWFYFLALILVLGAELNAFLAGHGPAEPAAVAPGPGAIKQSRRARQAAAASTNGRLPANSPALTVLWAGLSAAITGATLLAARQTAATIWRAVMREDPPTKSV